ncbi:MAG: hypothetical protein ACRDZO_20330 [Egibacteraceae bacterium]
MDPVTLGLTIAALVAKKALEQVGEQAGDAGWGLLTSVSERMRGWFVRRGDEAGVRALDVVEAAPDSSRAMEALAGAVTDAAREDAEEAGGLAELVGQVERAGAPAVTNFVNQVRDQAQVGRIIQVTGTYYEHGDG